MNPEAVPDAWHSVLLRQLKRSGLGADAAPADLEAWHSFLTKISTTYSDHDQQQYLHDRSFELSSYELSALNDDLRRMSESQLALQRDRLQAVFDSVPTGLAVVDEQLRLLDLNEAAERMLGRTQDEAAGEPLDRLLPAEDPAAIAPLRAACEAGVAWLDDGVVFRQSDDTDFYVSLHFVPLISQGARAGGVLSLEDLTVRKQAEFDLNYRASHDVLTGCLNRSSMIDRIHNSLVRSAVDGAVRAVMFLDLDRFKLVNDTLGHAAGDRLLILVARRLTAVLREVDALARIGGDEFVVLLEQVEDLDLINDIAGRIADALSEPFNLTGPDDDLVYISATIGIAVSNRESSPTTMLREADVALYEAKRAGRDRYLIFDDSLRDVVAERMRLERMLRAAIARGDLRMDFQPMFSLPDERLMGFEALLRWSGRDGPVEPSAFIPIAEETGLIHRLGLMALEQGIRFAADLDRAVGAGRLRVAVNVSALQVSHGDLPGQVAELLTRYGVAGGSLILEITETMLIEARDVVGVRLAQLAEQGVELALDDFGTGFASLSSLRELPLANVKVDRTFTQNLVTSHRDRAIVEAVVGLAHAMGLTVLAEGVETQAQVDAVTELGCDGLQGYFLGRPSPRESALALARSWVPPLPN